MPAQLLPGHHCTRTRQTKQRQPMGAAQSAKVTRHPPDPVLAHPPLRARRQPARPESESESGPCSGGRGRGRADRWVQVSPLAPTSGSQFDDVMTAGARVAGARVAGVVGTPFLLCRVGRRVVRRRPVRHRGWAVEPPPLAVPRSGSCSPNFGASAVVAIAIDPARTTSTLAYAARAVLARGRGGGGLLEPLLHRGPALRLGHALGWGPAQRHHRRHWRRRRRHRGVWD